MVRLVQESCRDKGSGAGDPSRKTAFVFQDPENIGMGRNIYFQAKSFLFSPHELCKNSGSGLHVLYLRYCTCSGEYVEEALNVEVAKILATSEVHSSIF